MRHLDNCLSLHNEYGSWNNFLLNHCSLLEETEEYTFYFFQVDRIYKVNKKTGEIAIDKVERFC